jgi:hypothetical protein
MVQVYPGGKPEPQVLPTTNEDAFAPATAMPEMASVAPPVLVRVTVCVELVEPTLIVPKDRLVAESDTVVGTIDPVPLRAIECGDPLALSVIEMEAVSAPEVVGAKWP